MPALFTSGKRAFPFQTSMEINKLSFPFQLHVLAPFMATTRLSFEQLQHMYPACIAGSYSHSKNLPVPSSFVELSHSSTLAASPFPEALLQLIPSPFTLQKKLVSPFLLLPSQLFPVQVPLKIKIKGKDTSHSCLGNTYSKPG